MNNDNPLDKWVIRKATITNIGLKGAERESKL